MAEAAEAAASGTRPFLFRPPRSDRRSRLVAAPGSALRHISPPTEGRTSVLCGGPGVSGHGRPVGRGRGRVWPLFAWLCPVPAPPDPSGGARHPLDLVICVDDK